MRFPVSCVENHWKCHVGRPSLGCKSLLTSFLERKETGLRHHPEDESGITGRQGKKYCEKGVDFFLLPTLLLSHLREGFLNHSSGHQMVLQRQVWSMCCWSRQEDEGMRKWRGTSCPDNHHNSCAAKWLIAAINVAREREREKRMLYMLQRRVMLCTLQIRGLGEQFSSLL